MNEGKYRQTAPAILVLFLAATVAAIPADANAAGQEENGVPLVRNPIQPPAGDQTIIPREMWRLGGEDDDSETVFGLIEDALVDDEGNTYLLDTILSTIYKIAPDGTLLQTLGQEGDGPGEFRNAHSLAFMPDGNIGILEIMSGKVLMLDRDGDPLPSFIPGEENNGLMNQILYLQATAQDVVVGRIDTEFTENTVTTRTAVDLFAPDGTLRGTYMKEVEEQENNTVTISIGGEGFINRWSLCPDGRVVFFRNQDEYELEVFAATAKPDMIIRREFQRVRRPDSEIEKDRKDREELDQRLDGQVDLPAIPEFKRPVSRVIPRPGGDLWVLNAEGERDCPEHSVGYFDVFDSEGRYLERIRIEADYDPERDNYRIRGGFLFIFKEAQKAPDRVTTTGGGGMMITMIRGSNADEDDQEDPRPYEVVCYRLD